MGDPVIHFKTYHIFSFRSGEGGAFEQGFMYKVSVLGPMLILHVFYIFAFVFVQCMSSMKKNHHTNRIIIIISHLILVTRNHESISACTATGQLAPKPQPGWSRLRCFISFHLDITVLWRL